ncbi:dystroglycan-related [Anaeramoeba flamelloides]|uniref:Dystroglycan-related n=1 Tax=Anaeramoeba flamelloides TaxID=1746091 RepID=A0AAV7YRN7_9EUKA|nr:dystroglycan-related [Anaeramoeba flamelloides]
MGLNKEKFVVAWSSNGQDGSSYGIFAQIFDSSDGTKVGKELQVNSYTNNNQMNPRMKAIGPNNEKFVITWESYGQDGTGNGVFAQNYKISENPEINEQIPQTQYFELKNYFNYQFSNESFLDPNEPNQSTVNLIYEAKLSNGNDLPNGLNFDSNKRQFSGSVSSEDSCLDWEIEIFALSQCDKEMSQTFNLSNSKPEINQQIPQDQYFSNTNEFNYEIPKDSFSDEQQYEYELTYEAKLSNGNDLPNGLEFDTNNKQFSGNVSIEDSCLDWEIEIFAFDYCDEYVSQTFNLLSSNEMPVIKNTIPDQVLSYGLDDYSDYQFQIPGDSFSDNEENELDLNYQAKLIVVNDDDRDEEEEQDLPEWLIFDENTRTFTINEDYQLTRNDMGNYTIKVIAIDYCNLNNSQDFNFEIQNDSPYLNKPINDIELNYDEDDEEDDDVSIFIFSEDTFIDPNNDQLSYTVYFNGIEDYLPCFIKFIETKRKFIFDVESAESGNHTIKIKASDDLLDTFDEFNLRVVKKSETDTDSDNDNDNNDDNDKNDDDNNNTDDKNNFSTGVIIGYSINGLIFVLIIISVIILFKKKNNLFSNSSRKKSDINIGIEENKSDDVIISGSHDIELNIPNNNSEQIDDDDDDDDEI